MAPIRMVLGSKIHRATVTQADLDYVGSISIDEDLMEAAGIVEWEKIAVLDVQWFTIGDLCDKGT